MSSYAAFAKYYDILTENIDYKSRAGYFDALIRRYAKDAKLVLDLACGTGSLTLALKNLGYDMIGVDISPDMLAIAAAKCGPDTLLLNQPMQKLNLYGTVDAAVCALDSINHLNSEKLVYDVFAKVSLFINTGGVFIFDVNTAYKHSRILAGNTFIYDMPEIFCCWQNNLDEKTMRVDINLDFFEKSLDGLYSRSSESFSEWYYSGETLTNALKQVGLELIDIFAGDTFESPEKESQRLVYAAIKR